MTLVNVLCPRAAVDIIDTPPAPNVSNMDMNATVLPLPLPPSLSLSLHYLWPPSERGRRAKLFVSFQIHARFGDDAHNSCVKSASRGMQ